MQTEAPQNPSGLGEEIEGYVLPENFAGNFYPNWQQNIKFFFHFHFRPDPKIITSTISRFFGTAMMEEGPNKLTLWKNIYNFF